MRGVLDKVAERFERMGPRDALRSLRDDAARRVVDANREIALMQVALDNPKARVQPGEAARWPFELRELDEATFPLLVTMLEASEPWRVAAVRARVNPRGFVAVEGGRAVGFLYYAIGADRPPHPDLAWLGMTLGPHDVYTYDSFIPPELRGRGTTMFRSAYAQLVARGYTTAHGFCYATEKAAMFTYRVLGWKETARIHEHRVLGQVVVVNGSLYKLNRFDRRRLFALPDAVPTAVSRLGRALVGG